MNDREIQQAITKLDLRLEVLLRELEATRQSRDTLRALLEARKAGEIALRPERSFRSILLQVVHEAPRGEPFHVRQAVEWAEKLGGHVNAKDKISRVDLGLASLKKQGIPLERVGTRLWKYTGDGVEEKKTWPRRGRFSKPVRLLETEAVGQ